jgi:SAM-dependent methyltransferase
MPRLHEFLLGQPYLYRGFRRLTGSDRVNREFVEEYVRPKNGDEILDIGCGPADVVELMPSVRYTGIDPSPSYIASARRRFGERARFQCGDLNSLRNQGPNAFDAIICMGVLHHLSDADVTGLLKRAQQLLRPGGRFISYDPCFTERQHPVARWIHSHDRGEFVRFDHQLERLVSGAFSSYRRHVRTDLCTVPATIVVFDCDAGVSKALTP